MSEQVPAAGDDEASGGPTEIEEPEPVEEDAEVADLPALSKWPWWASAVAAAVVLLALGITLYASWTYIISSDETAEKEDFEQLLGLLDRVETVALFVLGAILGASASVGAASGAASAATKNAKEAKKNHGRAKRNGKSAKQNAQVAGLAKRDALALAEALEGVHNQSRTGSGPIRIVHLRDEYPSMDLDDTTRPALHNLVQGHLDDSLTKAYVVPREHLAGVEAEQNAQQLSDAMDLAAKVRARWRS